ncbi:MAG: M24 family metallopeptidase [Candidatus Kerfeldbacteria bacterium]|nr:M24 family metallopeptidase [Candidatus Kerfeldbacteria bacterium]
MRRQTVLHGRVIHGERIGRRLGFPTANLEQSYFRTNPQRPGVYAAWIWRNRTRHDGLAVIGVPGQGFPHGKVELYLLDFSGSLYGETLTAQLLERIRPLIEYRRTETLVRRIKQDITAGHRVFARAEQFEKDKIAAVRRGVHELSSKFNRVRALIRVGRSEREVRDKLRRLFSKYQPSFPFIVASGPFGAFMHHVPTRRKLRRSDAVVVDFGIKVSGFCTDLTRTFFIGQPTSLQRRRYEAVLRASALGGRAGQPFVMARDVDRTVRGYLKQRQLARWFIHSTGHAVGKKIHEPPSLGPKSSGILLPGQVMTVEPGIYIPRWGGIRIEDMVQVSDRSSVVLTQNIPKNLHDIVVQV